MRAGRYWWCFTLAAIVIAATLGFPRIRVSADEPKAGGAATFHTATVTRGDLVTTVEATGTMEPEQVVDVGSQVCGIVTSFGEDPHSSSKSIDYGSQVEKGTLLAQIDDTLYVAQVEQARIACLARRRRIGAGKAKLALAKAEWQRAGDLLKSKSISALDLDMAKYTCEVAEASVAVAEVTSAQSKAAFKQAEINLGYTRIRSPIKGVIIDRRVNVGQTVVSNLGAASLFLIAKDLKELQVWASVNEADIGRIHKGMKSRFTVNAYPNETFVGECSSPPERHHDSERGDLHRRGDGGEQGDEVVAVYDGQPTVRDRTPRKRLESAQRGSALETAAQTDRCRRPRRDPGGNEPPRNKMRPATFGSPMAISSGQSRSRSSPPMAR